MVHFTTQRASCITGDLCNYFCLFMTDAYFLCNINIDVVRPEEWRGAKFKWLLIIQLF